jgi:hypothetical protein
VTTALPVDGAAAGEHLDKYAVFVQQDDGRGTTNISVYEAANCEEAEKLALIEAAADWNSSPDELRIWASSRATSKCSNWKIWTAGPVADGEPERGGLCPDCGGSPHDETPHEYDCPRNPEFREDRKKAL